ncbi:hypothetical protein BDV38DRAFT_283141 [Aspergillus pseudotamarii]|uniref:Zn(2)-C6 fungal-type domain-containing protein n=1 Tax=Aspergillus pseudotamarii TaxID=132259 RepID=A0A5N6SV88_ASPPS|nr:uncharacterized protein BDV38DRAFT_283141 [Aspergillus pseudotamarii]KAE8137303.1 hypothetical protein BDV38DRAFT_283141 [Aspergillus pseudotamarii]
MASSRTIRPIHHLSRPAPYVKSSRRQYKSCDHCRRNRRACDAAALGVNIFLGGNDYDENAPRACSSCTRSQKQCTFNWLLSRPKSVLPRSVKRKIDACTTAADLTISTSSAEAAAIDEPAYSNFNAGDLELSGVELDETAVPGLNEHIHQFGMASQWEHQPLKSQYTHPSFTTTSLSPGYTFALDNSTPSLRCDQLKGFGSTRQEGWELDIFHYHDDTAATASSLLEPSSSHSGHPSQSDYCIIENDGLSIDDTIGQGGLPGAAGAFVNGNDEMFDPFNPLQESISQGTNKSLISANLLRIYYDSIENALSCWVTESNCPYQKLKRREHELVHPGLNQKTKVGRGFSIYARVCQLDEAFVPFHSPSMTKADSLKATKALYAAVLAFASQWSHVRNTNSLFDDANSALGLSLATSTTFDGFAAPFEALVQQSVWHECRNSLLACDDSDSFKVIFARMIFSMTQQPPAVGDREKMLESQIWSQHLAPDRCRVQFPSRAANLRTTDLHSPSFNPGDMSGLEARSLAQINAVKDWDSRPTYLETALRYLASWRRRIAAQGSSQTYTRSSAQSAQMSRAIVLQSFDLLFWLGVMCDTTSSALTQRPLVIAEHDCELPKITTSQALPVYQTAYAHMSTTYGVGDTNRTGTTPELWGTYLLSSPRLSGDKARWPCSADEAFAILQEAIPVKVLLWRRVARLQTLTNARTGERDIEGVISATLSVYQHWTVAYGQFMRDCITNHESLPAKVQSWYVILGMHWHLGCLLAATCIEQVDNDSLSESLQRSLRRSSGLVLELKKANGNAISDLARVSCSSDHQTFRDSAEFHPALSDTPLLTEPWTNVLVQALEKACSVFLTWTSSRRHMVDEQHAWVYHNTNYSDLCSRASHCIDALKLLGRKSYAASLTAAALETQLTLVTSDQ